MKTKLNDDEEMKCLIKCKEGSKSARDKLILDYLYLVDKVARKFNSPEVEYDDLVQTGREGLIKGIDNFDFNLNYSLKSCIYSHIQYYIMRYLKDIKNENILPTVSLEGLDKMDARFSYNQSDEQTNLELRNKLLDLFKACNLTDLEMKSMLDCYVDKKDIKYMAEDDTVTQAVIKRRMKYADKKFKSTSADELFKKYLNEMDEPNSNISSPTKLVRKR